MSRSLDKLAKVEFYQVYYENHTTYFVTFQNNQQKSGRSILSCAVQMPIRTQVHHYIAPRLHDSMICNLLIAQLLYNYSWESEIWIIRSVYVKSTAVQKTPWSLSIIVANNKQAQSVKIKLDQILLTVLFCEEEVELGTMQVCIRIVFRLYSESQKS